MSDEIVDTGATLELIVDAGEAAPLIDEAAVAMHLEEGSFEMRLLSGEVMLDLPGLRRGLNRRLRSSGGRPSLEGASRRQPIPMTQDDWRTLQGLSQRLSAAEQKVSPGQVASQLLHQTLKGLRDVQDTVARKHAAGQDPQEAPTLGMIEVPLEVLVDLSSLADALATSSEQLAADLLRAGIARVRGA